MDQISVENPYVSEETPIDQLTWKFKIGCLDVNTTGSQRYVLFSVLTISTLFFCLISAYLQELIFQLDGFKPFGLYLTLIQFVCFTAFGLVELQFKSDKKRRIPLKTYGLISLLTVSTMSLSHISVAYLNYPTKVMFKCCKLIPVMIGGVLIQGRKYNFIDVLAMLCMCLGLTFFVLADNSASPNFNSTGIILISLALISDGIIANVQERAMKQHSGNNSEIILYSYSIGCIYILVGLIISGSLLSAYEFCKNHPVETYGYAGIYSLFGYFGVKSVLSLIGNFGALIAVTVTTCRKAITIILSFTFFHKPFTPQYVWSGLTVLLGIYLNVYSKHKESCDRCLFRKIEDFKYFIGWRRSHEQIE